jgi:hypothetical protein
MANFAENGFMGIKMVYTRKLAHNANKGSGFNFEIL